MAFGKNSSGLTGVGSWRQSASAVTTRAPRKGGGGGRAPTWVNSFKPSKNDPDNGRLIAGAYEVPVVQEDGSLLVQVVPFFPYVEHYDGRHETQAICSAGPYANDRNKKDPCYGCDIFWTDHAANKGQKGSAAVKRMSKRDMFAFNWLHNAPYVNVPQVDRKTGQMRMNQSGQPYMQWIPLLPHERAKYPETQFEIKMGHMLHWSMGFGHFNALLEYDKLIGKSCKSCGSRDSIESEAWLCGNEECGDAVIEMATTTLPSTDIEKLVAKPADCPYCHKKSYLQETMRCKQCARAARATLFDVDLSVKRIEGREGGNQTSLAVTSWSNPRDLDPLLLEQAVVADLPKIFAPNTLEFQAERFRHTPNAPTAAPGTPVRQPVTQGLTRGYSKPLEKLMPRSRWGGASGRGFIQGGARGDASHYRQLQA